MLKLIITIGIFLLITSCWKTSIEENSINVETNTEKTEELIKNENTTKVNSTDKEIIIIKDDAIIKNNQISTKNENSWIQWVWLEDTSHWVKLWDEIVLNYKISLDWDILYETNGTKGRALIIVWESHFQIPYYHEIEEINSLLIWMKQWETKSIKLNAKDVLWWSNNTIRTYELSYLKKYSGLRTIKEWYTIATKYWNLTIVWIEDNEVQVKQKNIDYWKDNIIEDWQELIYEFSVYRINNN